MSEETLVLAGGIDMEWEAWIAQAQADADELKDASLDAAIDAYLEQISDARDEIGQNDAMAQVRIDKIEHWRDEMNSKLVRRIEWLSRQVRALADGYDFGKRKSRDLAHGTFGFRKKSESIQIQDAGRALEFAKANGIPVQEKQHVNKTDILKYVRETGDDGGEAAGFELVDAREEFFVR